MNVLRIYYTTEHCYKLEQLVMNRKTVIYVWMRNQYKKSTSNIQMTSNDIAINVETKKNRINKMTKRLLIHLAFALQYITLTRYYIAKDTFR